MAAERRDHRARRIAIVVGMHRSGTSLLANALRTMGIDFGDRLMAAGEFNEEGYFEHVDIVSAHARALELLGIRWTTTSPLPARWWEAPALAPVRERLSKVVASEVAAARGTWGFKDPRTSRLIPMWDAILAGLGIEPVFLLAVRSPAAVARSLEHRDAIPPDLGRLIWLVYNVDALAYTRDRLALVVDYDRWFTDLRGQAEALLDALGIQPDTGAESIVAALAKAVRPDLRHYAGAAACGDIEVPYVEETYRLLQEAGRARAVPERLREIVDEVRRAQDLFAPLARAHHRSVLELERQYALASFRLGYALTWPARAIRDRLRRRPEDGREAGSS
jgi:hypothetical protein